MRKIKSSSLFKSVVKKTKKTRQQVLPENLIDISRDPAGRQPVRKYEEFKLPIPGTITSLRKFVPAPTKIEKQKETKETVSEKLSDYL